MPLVSQRRLLDFDLRITDIEASPGGTDVAVARALGIREASTTRPLQGQVSAYTMPNLASKEFDRADYMGRLYVPGGLAEQIFTFTTDKYTGLWRGLARKYVTVQLRGYVELGTGLGSTEGGVEIEGFVQQVDSAEVSRGGTSLPALTIPILCQKIKAPIATAAGASADIYVDNLTGELWLMGVDHGGPRRAALGYA